MNEIITKLKHGLIVSCQAFENEPFYGSECMAKMAKSAEIGGASGIRACWPRDIKAIKQVTALPVIGIYKVMENGMEAANDIIITPNFETAKAVADAGADIIALDCTLRERKDLPLKELP